MKSIDKYLNIIKDELKIIEQKTNLNPKIIIFVLGIALILSGIRVLGPYMISLIGILCPIYLNFKSFERFEKDDDKYFLKYWVIFGLLNMFDIFGSFIINRIPMYYAIKLVFLIWMFLPNFQGSILVYDFVIDPLFNKYEKMLDKYVKNIIKKGRKIKDKAIDEFEKNKKIIDKGAAALTKKLKKI